MEEKKDVKMEEKKDIILEIQDVVLNQSSMEQLLKAIKQETKEVKNA